MHVDGFKGKCWWDCDPWSKKEGNSASQESSNVGMVHSDSANWYI
jgi:hypothetical protein